jgi:hypothetical protein
MAASLAVAAAPSASEVMAAAEKAAATGHKSIFLVFHASW